jgi:glycosyltransferase involved in cell wall biosynthesis
VPEVVDDGLTGFVVRGEAEAIQAIGRLSELDRRQVRRQFEKRFATSRMAQEYLRHYEALSQPNAGETRAGIMPASFSA